MPHLWRGCPHCLECQSPILCILQISARLLIPSPNFFRWSYSPLRHFFSICLALDGLCGNDWLPWLSPHQEGHAFLLSSVRTKIPHTKQELTLSAWERKNKTEGVKKEKNKDSRKFQSILGLQEKHLHFWNFTYLYGAIRERFLK